MSEKQKKAFVLLLFAYIIFIAALILNAYWSNSIEHRGGLSFVKDIGLRVLYLLFSAIAISSFVSLYKENRKAKESMSKLFVPMLLISLPVLVLLGQLSSLVMIVLK